MEGNLTSVIFGGFCRIWNNGLCVNLPTKENSHIIYLHIFIIILIYSPTTNDKLWVHFVLPSLSSVCVQWSTVIFALSDLYVHLKMAAFSVIVSSLTTKLLVLMRTCVRWILICQVIFAEFLWILCSAFHRGYVGVGGATVDMLGLAVPLLICSSGRCHC